MSIYSVSPVGGGTGFKVHVADGAGGMRIVGVFLTRTDADAWIVADSRRADPSDADVPRANANGG